MKRVLVIDDEAVIRSALTRLLNRNNYDVVAVGSVSEAVVECDAQSFDLVIADLRLVLHHRESGKACTTNPRSLALLVGPEGGLTETEIEHAQAAGFRPAELGPRVLRTETAPLAAIAIAQARWGDMGASL